MTCYASNGKGDCILTNVPSSKAFPSSRIYNSQASVSIGSKIWSWARQERTTHLSTSFAGEDVLGVHGGI